MFGPQLTDILIRSVAVATFVQVPPEAKLVPQEENDLGRAEALPDAPRRLVSRLFSSLTRLVVALAGARAQWRAMDGRTPAQRLGQVIG